MPAISLKASEAIKEAVHTNAAADLKRATDSSASVSEHILKSTLKRPTWRPTSSI